MVQTLSIKSTANGCVQCNDNVAFGVGCIKLRKHNTEHCTEIQQWICFQFKDSSNAGGVPAMQRADVCRCNGDDILLCRDGSLHTATGSVPEGEVVARKNHAV